jgi:hypothetical protein
MKVGKKNMKKAILFSLICLYLLDCKAQKSDDNKTNLAILLALSNRSGTTGSRAQLRQASTARTAATTAASSARSAARASFQMDGRDKKKLMAFLKFHSFSNPKLSYTLPNQSLRTSPTAVTCTAAGGGACTDSTTSATFSGTSACDSGTVTLNSLTSTLSGASQDSLEINLTGGNVSFSSCQKNVTDFQNYPATSRSTITSGTLTPRGTYKLTDTISGTVSTTTTVEDLTINGTVVIGGTSIAMTNVRSQTTLTESIDLEKFKYIGANGAALSTADTEAVNTTGDFSKVFGISASSLVNGTLVVSGNIAGGDASTNQVFSNRTINYRYLCSKNWNDMTDADWSSDTVCTFTTN